MTIVSPIDQCVKIKNGDLNWIVKDRILAFAGPSYERHVSPEGYCTLSPNDYIPYFLQKRVTLVVRLNKKAYHEEDFVEAGINHVEAFFLDGSCPPMKILHGVVEAFEGVPADEAFAVHCKAGLGRTGTCIGAYLMKHFRMTARECIGWMRLCRPGMVIGPQQHFLEKIQPLMWQQGEAAGLIERPLGSSNANNNNNSSSSKNKKSDKTGGADHEDNNGKQSKQLVEDADAVKGRSGQAEGLLAARQGRKAPPSMTTTPPSRGTGKSKVALVTPDSKQAAVVTPDANRNPSAPELWCG